MSVDIEHFRQRLAAELASTEEALAQADAAAATVKLDQSSVGRLTRMDALQQQALAQGLRERLLTRLRRVRAAADRVDAGTFGTCCSCGASLDAARLHNDPATVFCADCLQERERAG